MSYRQVEHTADVALLVESDSIEALFADAARGLFSLMIEARDISQTKLWKVELSAPDLESLLIDWLNELVFLFEVEGAVVAHIYIDSLDDNKITARLAGEPFDSRKHEVIRQIKAATYHALEIKKNDFWEATIVFDV